MVHDGSPVEIPSRIHLAIRGTTIPGHGPVEYRATDSGFDLSCRPGSTGKPVVLQVVRERVERVEDSPSLGARRAAWNSPHDAAGVPSADLCRTM